ncbi:AP-3 complex subunit beta [Fistulifera solaris]|jgi:AP-3 complex subunit beta|uniref:AP-3 complex subunit beta n=1 Tax=Fistulifera solaris TaxID=1519565 RepID=A0A1Z5K6H3_FISSO|nr:AP-3 complex subunit beta [Fistulifera solaris]|eukprot:GAX21819.1 AP-3 complex subunit beta [Fistulifera solaris]
MWNAADPATVLHQQLASALSTMGDAQYWEESISPATIKQSLLEADPSNPHHTSTFLRAMKWLLASISKGRNVSEFYPHVVKCVGVINLEVRKMVYMYLVQYADYDTTTRELSLLSINSFQRGLADAEQWIRALALRVLTSIRIPDILQIQILGVQKCASDRSPYVRKCAANALSKLAPRCDELQFTLLLELMQQLLQDDSNTMVLTSALIAFTELCPDQLHRLHPCFHKICHLLTDFDEWGQVVTIDLLARYCRQFFQQPVAWKEGTAERIDRQRRVRRTLITIEKNNTGTEHTAAAVPTPSLAETSAAAGVQLPPRIPQKIKRRVVKKGFYSDEEDESTEEEVYAEDTNGPALPISKAFRENPVSAVTASASPAVLEDHEDSELAPDHRLLLQSALPLLKSRNAGVVLAVCSLQYYCGVSSIKVRAAMGKALVRIHRDRREIQYVVLTSIRTLAKECPSAFAPFLHDFLVKAMDPPFTRLIKLDILSSLALEPSAIQLVLKELGSYVRHGDRRFACAAIQAVGKIAEMARIVHDRRDKMGRDEANTIALNCLHGLLTLSQTVDHRPALVGESIIVMQCILQLLRSDSDVQPVKDPNHVQDRAVHRILLLLVYTLSKKRDEPAIDAGSEDEDEDADASKLQSVGVSLPAPAVASALWVIGECLLSNQKSVSFSPIFGKYSVEERAELRHELLRLVAKAFPVLHDCEKEQSIHFATRLLLTESNGITEEEKICEQILSLGRLDVNPDVRDQARMFSGMIHAGGRLKHDLDGIEGLPLIQRKLEKEQMQRMFTHARPQVSFLPVEGDMTTSESGAFRFGTLSSMVGHKARNAYVELPPWAAENSPSSLRERDPNDKKSTTSLPNEKLGAPNSQFYNDGDDSDSDDSSSSSSSNDDDSSSSSSSSSDDSSQQSSSSVLLPMPSGSITQPSVQNNTQQEKLNLLSLNGGDTSDDSSSADDSSSSSSSSSESSSNGEQGRPNDQFDLISMNTGRQPHANDLIPMHVTGVSLNDNYFGVANVSLPSVADDLKGLVLSPPVAGPTDQNWERDSGAWIQLVRPEHAGGLSVQGRYLRGFTKSQQVQKLGLTVDKPSVVCLQLRFENRSPGVFRRIRVLQRSQPVGSSIIRPRLFVPPPEIDLLEAGKQAEGILGIDFMETSDRDGSMQAKVDIKYGTGGIPVEIKPSIGDLLLPCQRSVSEFDTAMARLQGFQRVELSVQLDTGVPIQDRILGAASLTVVGSDWSSNGVLRFVGTLPASGDPVYILITTSKVTVCCDHALVVSNILNIIKRALQ